MPLVDQFGDPIPAAQLERPIAEADLSKFRQVWTGMYQSAGLTPQRVSHALRMADAGHESPWLHLCEEMEEKDGHFAALLGVRKRAVAQLPISVEAAGDDATSQTHAELIRRWLDTGALDLATFDIMDAVAKGFSIHEIEWETTSDHVWPRRLLYRYPHWFGIEPTDGDTVKLREGGSKLVDLAHYKFLVHKARFKSGMLIRGGLARVAVWSWMFKSFTMKDWAIFVQNYGQPIRLGRYDSAASERDKDALYSAIANIAGDMAAMIPSGMQIEFIGMKEASRTAEIYLERCKYLDQQLSKIVLGGTTTVDAISGGHAVSQEHQKVREDIERADAQNLSATLTHQLVPLIISLNFGPQTAYPRLRVGRPDELPLKDIVDAADKLGKLGLTIPASEMRRRMGVPDPQVGEDVIGGRASQAMKDGMTNAEAETGAADQQEDDAEDATKDASEDPAGDKTAAKITLQSQTQIEPFDMVEKMAERLAEEAGASLGLMLKQIRKELMAAKSLEDAHTRLESLEMDMGQFDEKLARSMALAHLAGQTSVIDQTGG